MQRSKDVPFPLIEALRKLHEAEGWNLGIDIGERFEFAVDDIYWHPNEAAVTLLIGLGDRRAREAAYRKLRGGKLRPQPMEEGEGGGSSAHLTIRLKTSELHPLSYPAVLEEADGCSRDRVERFLSRLLNERCEFHEENGSIRRKRKVKLSIDTWNDAPLVERADEARLLQVTLRHKAGNVDDGKIEQVTEEVRFQPQSGRGLDHAVAVIKAAKSWLIQQPPEYSSRFNSMLLRVQRPDSNREATIELPITQAESLAGVFQKVALISGFEDPLPSATEKVNRMLATKMENEIESRP